MQSAGTWTRSFLHLIALAAFTVAQPLFDIVSRSPEFFVAHRTTPAELAILAAALLFLVPSAVMMIATAADAMRSGAGRLVVAAGVAVFTALFVLQLLRPFDALPALVSVIAAVIGGLAAAIGYARFVPLRSFVTLLSVASIAFPLLFFLNPSIRKLLRPTAVAASGISIARPAPVVVVLFDQFPLASLIDSRGNIEVEAYPAFAELAARGTWYRNATTVNPVTGWAAPAVVTGVLPRPEDLPVASDHPRSLFTLLGGTHGMHVSEPITDLCPDALCISASERTAARVGAMLRDLSVVYLHLTLPRDLTGRLPSVTQDWKNFAAGRNWQRRWETRRDDARDEQFLEFIAGIRREARPVLHYLHVLLPHDPYVYLPSGVRYTTEQSMPGLSSSYVWSSDEWAVTQGYQRHLLQAAFADFLLGQLLDRLKAENLFDEALIVVTADHGGGFRAGGPLRNVDPEEFAAIMAVPLLVKRPHQPRGEVRDRNMETIDVLPTIASVLGIDFPWKVDGIPPDGPERGFKSFSYERVRVTRRFPPSMLDQVLALASRKESVFGRATGRFRTPQDAPAPSLVGRAVSDLPVHRDVAPSAEGTFDSQGPALMADPASGFVPARPSGTVRWEGMPDRLPLAIAVNGTVRATTWTLHSRNPERPWSAMVPADAFTHGRNRLELYVVDEHGRRVRLLAKTE